MALTLTGDGSITGLAVGGLPDLSVGTADIADAAITAAKMSGAQSGSAPIYGARAWVNFNGTGAVTINGSGNVTSITDDGTGIYTVNITTAMPDVNYCVNASAVSTSISSKIRVMTGYTALAVTVRTSGGDTSVQSDSESVFVSIFR